MKRFALYVGIVATMASSCSIRDDIPVAPQMFYASIEQSAIDTKVYSNEALHLCWTADDRVSLFNNSTYNQQYRFTGETGDSAGGFTKVDTDEFVTGREIPHVVSVYPYRSSTRISENETLTITLPSEQYYAENTFGLGANTMVSVSSDDYLQYKNTSFERPGCKGVPPGLRRTRRPRRRPGYSSLCPLCRPSLCCQQWIYSHYFPLWRGGENIYFQYDNHRKEQADQDVPDWNLNLTLR